MNIAIIGGSITEGAGASNYNNTYVYSLEQYFKEKDKNTVIKNLGAGGTASQFGIFRLKRDLGDFKPDVILVEFAVNDRIYSSYDSSIYFEGLIRECFKITDKIIIIDFPTGMADSCTSIHKKIAYYYNIPIIDVQDEVWKRIGSREFNWAHISIDNLHPNNKGHKLYYEIIKEKLKNINLEEGGRFNNKTLMLYKFNDPRIASYNELEFYGHWREESFNLNNKFTNAAVTNTINDGVIFKFKGKYLAMMNLLTQDSGILECELDNKFTFTMDLYRESQGIYENTINLNDLEDKEHVLVMKISDKRNEKSLGNKVVIGGFLVEC